jgi:hypothetical protein
VGWLAGLQLASSFLLPSSRAAAALQAFTCWWWLSEGSSEAVCVVCCSAATAAGGLAAVSCFGSSFLLQQQLRQLMWLFLSCFVFRVISLSIWAVVEGWVQGLLACYGLASKLHMNWHRGGALYWAALQSTWQLGCRQDTQGLLRCLLHG